MSYSSNPVTDGERRSLFMLGRMGLAAALVALALTLLKVGAPYHWLAIVIAGADLFSITLNYRARDEYLDRLSLAGGRWALGLASIWMCVVAGLSGFLEPKGMQVIPLLRDPNVILCSLATAFFAGFNFCDWRER